MVKDETCNTYLSREEAIVEKVGGKDFYFCSQECRLRFLEKSGRKSPP
jgi:YHS domain-containing protein